MNVKDKAQGVLFSIAKTTLLNKVMTEVDISGDAYFIEPLVMAEIFPRIPWVHRYDEKDRVPIALRYMGTLRMRDSRRGLFTASRFSVNYPSTDGEYVDYTTWRGIKIFINMTIVEKESREKRSIRLYTAKTNNGLDIIKDFVYMLKRKSDSIKRRFYFEKFSIVTRDNIGQIMCADSPRTTRTFENVFIPKKSRDAIINSIGHFLKSKKWYEDSNIPYHFGILLHGPAGTGKSSVTQAIMNNWECDAYVISSTSVRWTMDTTVSGRWLFENTYGIPRFIICEDVDTAVFGGETREELEERMNTKTGHFGQIDRDTMYGQYQQAKATLGNVLNFMDGLSSPQNTIYIFTTNHLDHLDPALIRPGRIDLIIEIGYVDDETMDEFLMFHYNRHLPAGKRTKTGLTFAMLQTKVMIGMSFDDLIKEACDDVQEDSEISIVGSYW